MKLIINEYLSLLKEDGELDTLLINLLIGMGITPLTKPQRGRQFGVDIAAVGIDPEDQQKKVFLLVVKQGNLSRDTWNNGKNSVRQSIDDIIDTYIESNLTPSQRKLPKHIIVATNGDLEQTANQSWAGYVKKNSITGEIEFSFWGMDQLTGHIEAYLLNESLFPEEHRSLLLKTLAFLELRDYDLRHFYKLINEILSGTGNQKQVTKKLRLSSLCLNILWKWCEDMDNLKPVLIASERLLLHTWDWFRKNDLFDKRYALEEFYKLQLLRIDIGRTYFVKIREHCFVKDSLYRYSQNPVEYSLLVWEEIGHISLIGIMEYWEGAMLQIESNEDSSPLIQQLMENANFIGLSLGNIIQNNPPALYPKYDEHCIEISMALHLLFVTHQEDHAKKWLTQLIIGVRDNYVVKNFFPLFYSDYEKLLAFDLKNDSDVKVDSSMLITILAEWCVILDMEPLYKLLREIITADFADLNLQLWYPETNTEEVIYTSDAGSSGSCKTSIVLPISMADYKKEMVDEFERFGEEKTFSAVTNGVSYLLWISNRHYRSYPLPFNWRIFVAKDQDKQA